MLVTCQRHQTTDRYMADLPAVRVRQAYRFENTMPDRFYSKCTRDGDLKRKRDTFICLVTSEIYRCTSPMYLPLRQVHPHLQRQRNSVGAKEVLDDMYKLNLSQQHNTQVTEELPSEGIKQSFIPPHAPHWGGKWESDFRSVKLHLRRVTWNSILTFDQMYTLLTQIKSVDPHTCLLDALIHQS